MTGCLRQPLLYNKSATERTISRNANNKPERSTIHGCRPKLFQPFHAEERHRAQPHRGVADVPVPVAARLADRLAHRAYGPLCDRRRRHRVLRGDRGRGSRPQDPQMRRHLARRPDRRIRAHRQIREGVRRRAGDAARPLRRARVRARPAVQPRCARRAQQGRRRRRLAVDLVERGDADRRQAAAARDGRSATSRTSCRRSPTQRCAR